jgi:hypothetical protein
MPAPRLIVFVVLLSISHFFAFSSHAEIISWVDNNGVRHFSNTGDPGNGEKTDTASEHISGKSDQRVGSKKILSNVLKMYEKDREKYNKKKEKDREEQLKKEAEEREKEFRKKMDELGKKIKEGTFKNKRRN